MSDIFGHISKKALASYDQASSSWKTSEDISASDSKKFSKSLPKSGMTQFGQLFELQMSEHPIEGHDCSSLLNLPTPTVSDIYFETYQRRGVKGNHNVSLPHAVKMLPTPQARDWKGASTRNIDLNVAVKLLPTPTAMHVRNHDEPLEVFQARQARSSTGQIGMSTGVAVRLLPTPTGMNNRETGKCRDWGADLTHGIKCDCAQRRIHWI